MTDRPLVSGAGSEWASTHGDRYATRRSCMLCENPEVMAFTTEALETWIAMGVTNANKSALWRRVTEIVPCSRENFVRHLQHGSLDNLVREIWLG